MIKGIKAEIARLERAIKREEERIEDCRKGIKARIDSVAVEWEAEIIFQYAEDLRTAAKKAEYLKDQKETLTYLLKEENYNE